MGQEKNNVNDIDELSQITETTAISSSKNDTISSIIYNDKVRYVQKGYGLCFAILIFFCYFYFYPIILKSFWKEFIALADKKVLEVVTSQTYVTLMITLANLMMWFICVKKIPFFERYRVNNRPWPWEQNPIQWKKTLKKTLRLIFFNSFCVQLPLFVVFISIFDSKCRWDYESFPTRLETMVQITFMMLVEDFSFYWMHRLFHTPYLYKKFHKYHHEFVTPIALGTLYAHPLEHILANVLPSQLGFVLLGSRGHYATYIQWAAIRIFETIDGHCGYEFSWSPYRLLPFSGSSEYHNFHHTHNVGIYGSFFTFWDSFYGTNKDYFQFKAKKEKENMLNMMRSEYKNKQKVQ